MLQESNQPMSENQQATSAADAETAGLAEVYAILTAKDQSKSEMSRRIAAFDVRRIQPQERQEGQKGQEEDKERFTKLDAAGRCEYMREAQKKRRLRQKNQTGGCMPMSLIGAREALGEAVLLLLAMNDGRADAILDLAARAFELPDVAADAVRRQAKAHARQVKRRKEARKGAPGRRIDRAAERMLSGLSPSKD